jgi:hypothetical protein
MKRPSIAPLAVAITLLFVFSTSCRKLATEPTIKSYMETVNDDRNLSSTGIPLSRAKEIATLFLQSKNKSMPVSIKSAETVVKNGVPYMHIINANNNAGFVVISADSLYVPILAHSDKGNFNKQEMSPGLAVWFNVHGDNMQYIRTQKGRRVDSIVKINKMAWVALDKDYHISTNSGGGATSEFVRRVNDYDLNPTTTLTGYYVYNDYQAPLLQTNWHQEYPFNTYCPPLSYGGGNVPAGCTPIAMAQIMNFWQYPSAYDWSSTNTWPHTEAARLIHDIGTTTGPFFMGSFTSYGDNASGTNDAYCPYVFNDFGYSSADRTTSISDQILWGRKNGTVYAGLLVDEVLNHHRPVVVGGNSDVDHPWWISPIGLVEVPGGVGHSWVADGCDRTTRIYEYTTTYNPELQGLFPPTISEVIYTQGLLHMNWGWGAGYNTGWYDYSTNYTQQSATKPDFTYFQIIIYNIHP